MFKHVA